MAYGNQHPTCNKCGRPNTNNQPLCGTCQGENYNQPPKNDQRRINPMPPKN